MEPRPAVWIRTLSGRGRRRVMRPEINSHKGDDSDKLATQMALQPQSQAGELCYRTT